MEKSILETLVEEAGSNAKKSEALEEDVYIALDTIKIDSIGLYEPTVNEDIQNCDSMQLKCMADTNTACK